MKINAWNKLLEYETRDLVERYIKTKYDREASARQVLEITSCFIQAREYFINSQRSNISVRPLLQYYGVLTMSRGLILILNPTQSESSLKPSHGLETKNWLENLTKKKFADLKISIANGTFLELINATKNRSYFKNNSSAVSWHIDFEIPKAGSEIKLEELIRTLSDLSEEFETWTQQKLYFAQLSTFKHLKDSNEFEYSVGSPINSSQDLINIFPKEQFGELVFDSLKVKTSASIIPQFSQRFRDSFNSGIGEIVLTKSINKDLRLNTLSQFFALSYFMGMLSRYYPSVWMSLSRSEKGDAIYPLFIKAMEFIDESYPLTVLEFLLGPYDKNKNH